MVLFESLVQLLSTVALMHFAQIWNGLPERFILLDVIMGCTKVIDKTMASQNDHILLHFLSFLVQVAVQALYFTNYYIYSYFLKNTLNHFLNFFCEW